MIFLTKLNKKIDKIWETLTLFNERIKKLELLVKNQPTSIQLRDRIEKLEKAKAAMVSGRYGLVILDEANVALHFGLFPVEELINLIAGKPEGVELVITGRGASPEVIDRADLVTEMKSIKHYFDKKVPARKGIEM